MTPNITPIQLGMTGSLVGRRYRVAGRIGMAMDESGETWRWTEFLLVEEGGGEATLVHEVVDGSAQWRLFTYFEPKQPLSLDEVTARKVGDRFELDGIQVEVTLVGESRVEFIEGQAPEGVETGDVARYFNAEVGPRMWVISWTGTEIECFRGLDLPDKAIYAAFRIDASTLPPPPAQDPFRQQKTGFGVIAVVLGAAFISFLVVLSIGEGCRHRSSGPVHFSSPAAQAVAVRSAPTAPPLKLGATGDFEGRTWRVMGERTVEIARVHERWQRHEYLLVDAADETRWLVCGLGAGSPAWYLFKPVPDAERPALAPTQAAALKVGESLAVGERKGTILDLHLFRPSSVVPDPSWSTFGIGTGRFGFTAEFGRDVLAAVWDEEKTFLGWGSPVSPQFVQSAFRSP